MMSLADLRLSPAGVVDGHRCQAPTRAGTPCQRLAPDRFPHCPWHRQDAHRPDRRQLARQLAAFLAERRVTAFPMSAGSGWCLIVPEPDGGRLLAARWCRHGDIAPAALAVWLRKLPGAPKGWGRELWILTPEGWQGHATLAGRRRPPRNAETRGAAAR